MNDCVNITREIIINGNLVTNREEFFETLRGQLGEDVLIGSNLDALHDALTSLSGPADITIIERDSLEQNLGTYWHRVFTVLMDCLDENCNLSLSFEENGCTAETAE